jgi:hypothetical protein
VTHAAMGVRDTIQSSGVESLPPLPAPSFTRADADRLSEIRAISRTDPHASESNKALQQEELSLIEIQQASKGPAAPIQSRPAPTSAPSATPAPSTDRLAQIREMRRNDPSAYDRDSAVQAEELSLIEASLPPPASVADSAPSSQPAEGTSSE